MKRALGWVALIVVSGPLWAWSTVHLWRWFVVPLGVRDIGLWHAYGVSLVIHMFTRFTSEDEAKPAVIVGRSLAWPLLALALGRLCLWGMS